MIIKLIIRRYTFYSCSICSSSGIFVEVDIDQALLCNRGSEVGFSTPSIKGILYFKEKMNCKIDRFQNGIWVGF